MTLHAVYKSERRCRHFSYRVSPSKGWRVDKRAYAWKDRLRYYPISSMEFSVENNTKIAGTMPKALPRRAIEPT